MVAWNCNILGTQKTLWSHSPRWWNRTLAIWSKFPWAWRREKYAASLNPVESNLKLLLQSQIGDKTFKNLKTGAFSGTFQGWCPFPVIARPRLVSTNVRRASINSVTAKGRNGCCHKSAVFLDLMISWSGSVKLNISMFISTVLVLNVGLTHSCYVNIC